MLLRLSRLPLQFNSVTTVHILIESNQGDEETTKVRAAEGMHSDDTSTHQAEHCAHSQSLTGGTVWGSRVPGMQQAGSAYSVAATQCAPDTTAPGLCRTKCCGIWCTLCGGHRVSGSARQVCV